MASCRLLLGCVSLCILFLVQESYACKRNVHCQHGCCGDKCCPRIIISPPVRWKLPLKIGGAAAGVAIFLTSASIWYCCRRRRFVGIIVHEQPTVVIEQDTMSIVNTEQVNDPPQPNQATSPPPYFTANSPAPYSYDVPYKRF